MEPGSTGKASSTSYIVPGRGAAPGVTVVAPSEAVRPARDAARVRNRRKDPEDPGPGREDGRHGPPPAPSAPPSVLVLQAVDQPGSDGVGQVALSFPEPADPRSPSSGTSSGDEEAAACSELLVRRAYQPGPEDDGGPHVVRTA